jgi:GGDEF domain-containing protein
LTKSDVFLRIASAYARVLSGAPRLSEAAKPQPVGDRRNLERALQAVFDSSARDGAVVSVAVLDLIGMREFNVRNGWSSGDEVVRRFRELLGRSLNERASRFLGVSSLPLA